MMEVHRHQPLMMLCGCRRGNKSAKEVSLADMAVNGEASEWEERLIEPTA